MKREHHPHNFEKVGIPSGPAYASSANPVLLIMLIGAAVLSSCLPVYYFFDESFIFTGFFLLLLLGLYGPAACIVGAVLAHGAAWLLVNADPIHLLHVLQFIIVALLHVLLRRRLLLAQALFVMGIAVPFFLVALLLGFVHDPRELWLIVTKDLVHSLLDALVVEAFIVIGMPLLRRSWHRHVSPHFRFSRRKTQDGASHPDTTVLVHVRMRSLLIYATFGPLLFCAMLLYLFAGLSSMREIVGKARGFTTSMASGMSREMAGWTNAERRSLSLNGVIEAARLEEAFRFLSRDMPAKLVLFYPDGTEQLHVHGSTEDVHIDWARAASIDLGDGLLLVAERSKPHLLHRSWADGLFVQSFTMERQAALITLPLRHVDDIIDLQYRMILTVGPFLLLSLGLLLTIGHVVVRALNRLAEGTTGLLSGLGGGNRPEIAPSGITEIDALADNFRFMSATLDELFQELQSTNEDLATQSEHLRRSEAEMFRLAHFDVLTQLPNRHYLRKTLHDFIASQRPFSLMLVDLDRFKPINDQHGHHVGDLVLQEVGRVFREVIGDSVEQGRFACRLGGDEFVAVVADLSPDEVRQLAEKLIGEISAPIRVAGVTARVLASVGVSRYPDQGQDPGMLLKQADRAMYRAKRLGGNALEEERGPDA